MISQQNTRLDYLGADIRPQQPEPLTAATVAGSVMKPTCAPDDGSDAGPWFNEDAAKIDPGHRYANPTQPKETDNA